MLRLKSTVIKAVIVVVMALVLFLATSFIPLKGHYVLNAVGVGDAAHRDVRGIPFVFLRRSLEDGQCEVANEQSKTCLSNDYVQDHVLKYSYLAIDIAFWIVISTVLVELYTIRNQKVLDR
jgi:hypothetical protein